MSTQSTTPAGLDQTAAKLKEEVRDFLANHDHTKMDRLEFLRARYDAGLAWVNFPEGLGGKGLDRSLQGIVADEFAASGAPDNKPSLNVIGLGMAAPTLLKYATPQQLKDRLRPMWTGEEIWCQLFSEPGAGSDLAGLATSAVQQPGGDWVINGQKVWTSLAHEANWAILVTRSDPSAVKHRGMTYFFVRMDTPGVDVRPLRQITGEAEFNEVFLDDVHIPDEQRLGEVGAGWAVAQTTLMNERVAIGGRSMPREGGAIGPLAHRWRNHPESRDPALHDTVLNYWVQAEALRLTSVRLGQQLAAGQPGPEGSGVKLAYSTLAQETYGLELEVLGEAALRYDDYSMGRPNMEDRGGRGPGFRFLRSKANSIEGGTSEIMRNIISERVLGLPPEYRVDKDLPWKDLAR
ncbi:alkylation response protein AidB-like acyl-CoA dehydrogenase [Antricoccus suffuscus]|uniref:Alkylation response protein AidB-like acyl-CoA dehydrogenase n=1 Tax=Antricoccus suffuscus TaxID=1629062 RepID=A0A2T0Z1J1_9ACTN|nr:acyl-CoA dehydrogenase family protein [Antricoccus suffuscus]PRZ30193.1 alkylation response protein AidB-like acyl-CoA dehydrogenase [Antricoccus suffuscus]